MHIKTHFNLVLVRWGRLVEEDITLITILWRINVYILIVYLINTLVVVFCLALLL